ncbi:MAG TPA: aspartate aminotransferase, partial [Terriglobia bacterium]|nr:aspartate aminotransferase [Terriglobia bacterium]
YPFYGVIARAAGLAWREFPTLPSPAWPVSAPTGGDEVLLVANPLKPLGRTLDAGDVASLETWLGASSRRRLLLDTVYTFATRFDAATLRLLDGRQTILLHSLTKGWLHPRLFGIALVTPWDVAEVSSTFRDSPPPQENLARARECLGIFAETPFEVAKALKHARAEMLAAVPIARSAPSPHCPGYFVPIEKEWRELLSSHNVLALPASVFGSHRTDITIISSLSFDK